jgi:hypothetical protein
LHLGEEPQLGVVIEGGGVVEEDPNPELGQLVEDQHLIGVGPGQPVGREAPHGLEGAGFALISQRVQTGTVQAGAGVAVIAELSDQVVALGPDASSQDLELGTDGAAGFLGVARHPGVDSNLHRCPFWLLLGPC